MLAASLLLVSSGCGREQEALAKLPPPGAPSTQPGAVQQTPGTADAAVLSTSVPSAAGPAADNLLRLSGTTDPARRATITPKTGGTVARVLVREGDTVQKGAAVVQLDGADFALRVRAAVAGQTTAKAQVHAARVEWERLGQLLKDRATSRSQYERIDAQLQVARAALGQADAAVAMARRDQANSVVRAPFAGIVSAVWIAEGEYAAMMPPMRLVTIEEIDQIQLKVAVPETALERVKVGTPIEARFAALPGRTLSARITRVVRSVDPRTRAFMAIADLPNKDGRLRGGMFAEVRVLGGTAPGPSR